MVLLFVTNTIMQYHTFSLTNRSRPQKSLCVHLLVRVTDSTLKLSDSLDPGASHCEHGRVGVVDFHLAVSCPSPVSDTTHSTNR